MLHCEVHYFEKINQVILKKWMRQFAVNISQK